MGKKDNKKKKRLRLKGLLIVILFLYLISSCIYYLWSKPIKNINIEGNYYLKDNYLINYLNIENSSIIKVNRRSIKNKLLELDLVSDVKVSKNYFGILNIKIVEDKALFYNWNTKKIVLSSGNEIEKNSEYLGIPTLINYVKDDIYNELVERLNKIDKEVLALVSEIEYNPSTVNDKMVDETRFLFRMNDGNQVFINTINIEKLNDYLSTYEAITNIKGNVTGCLYLDSNSENNHFNNCEELVVEGSIEDGTKD